MQLEHKELMQGSGVSIGVQVRAVLKLLTSAVAKLAYQTSKY